MGLNFLRFGKRPSVDCNHAWYLNWFRVEPEGIYGRKDPYDWSDGSIKVVEIAGIWHLASIALERRGTFRCLDDFRVFSRDGYYEYKYNYIEGKFS